MTIQTNLKSADAPSRGAAEAGLRSRDLQTGRQKTFAGLSAHLLGRAVVDSFHKLDPRTLWRNPVMFVVEIVAALTTILVIRDAVVGTSVLFSAQIAFWLWFTVVFANFAEAVAEGRGQAQAENLRRMRPLTQAKRLFPANPAKFEKVSALDLKPGDLVLVDAGDFIPSDGDVIEGVASVDESAITGESAPVIRESGGGPPAGPPRARGAS